MARGSTELRICLLYSVTVSVQLRPVLIHLHIIAPRSANATGWNRKRWLEEKHGYFASALSPAAHTKQLKSSRATIQIQARPLQPCQGQGRSRGFHFPGSLIIEWSIFDLMNRVDLQSKRKRECHAC